MAHLYPENIDLCKSNAERELYSIFKTFSDSFHIIHSLGWLSSVAAKELNRFTPEGEIDFVIIHKDFGILCIEIKGGRITYSKHAFFYNGKQIKNPYNQVRDNAHTIRRLSDNLKNITIGYAVGFPNSKMEKFNKDEDNITFDFSSIYNLEEKITEIYKYWNKSIHRRNQLNDNDLKLILNDLLPESMDILNGKIEYDNRIWLSLSAQQNNILTQALDNDKFFISGRAGTGKTILAIILSRLLAQQNKKTLFLTYNRKISEKIKQDLSDKSNNIEVLTFHHFLLLNNIVDEIKHVTGNETKVLTAIIENTSNQYDCLIIDEAQSFPQIWLNLLNKYFIDKKIYIFADELQSFGHEGKILDKNMGKIFKFSGEMILSKNYRSPYKVYKRLIEIFTPSIEQTTPRSIDSLDLVECVTDNLKGKIENTIDSLLKESISKDNIVLLVSSLADTSLKKFSYKEVETYTVQSYRGMEKPIVIYVVTSADKKDLNELYVAYSRSTTQTIVIIPEGKLSRGKSHYEKILLNSDITDDILKNLLQEQIESFNTLLLANHEQIKLHDLSLYYSKRYLLFINHEYSFINRLLIESFLKNNISSIQTNYYDVNTARLYSNSFQDMSSINSLEYDYCDECNKVTYLKKGYRDNFCVNCNNDKMDEVNIQNILNIFNILENPKQHENEIPLLDDSIKSVGRFYYLGFNKIINDKTRELLNSQSCEKDISCIIEILIVLYRHKHELITINEIRSNQNIKKLNIEDNKWTLEIGININRFLKQGLLEKLEQKSNKKIYKINKNKIFKNLYIDR